MPDSLNIPVAKLIHLFLIFCLLVLINRPWLSPFVLLKLKVLVFTLFVYTSIFSSKIPTTSLEFGTVFWKCLTFVLEVLIGTLTSTFIMRWRHPAVLDLIQRKSQKDYTLACPALGVLLFMTGITVGKLPLPEEVKSTLNWSLPVIGVLWYGGGNFILKRKRAASISAVVPTFLLCFVETLTIPQSVAQLQNSNMIIGVQITQVLYYTLLNTVIMAALCGLDKAFAVLYICNHCTKKTGSSIIQAFFTEEAQLPQNELAELETAIGLLKHNTKSFWLASFLFSDDVRTDMCILYSFCRVTDDMVDNENDLSAKRAKIEVVKRFLNQLFSKRSVHWPKVIALDENQSVDWDYFEKILTYEELCAFRAISRISHFLPSTPLHDLARGFEWDIENREVKNQNDLVKYCGYVAGTVGELSTAIAFYRANGSLQGCEEAFQGFRDIGVALQLTNIARDIITDSETLGRVYIPTDWLADAEKELEALRVQRNPKLLDIMRIRSYAIKALDLADKYRMEGLKRIHLLPKEYQRPMLCTMELYLRIGDEIKANPGYHERASVSKFRKAFIAFKTMYLPIPMNS